MVNDWLLYNGQEWRCFRGGRHWLKVKRWPVEWTLLWNTDGHNPISKKQADRIAKRLHITSEMSLEQVGNQLQGLGK